MADDVATPDTPERTAETGRALELEAIERRLQAQFPDLAATIRRGELTVYASPDQIVDLLAFCRDDADLDFDLLSDVSGVHWPGGEHFVDPQISTTGWPPHRLTAEEGSIEVTYHLASMRRHHRLRIVVAVDDDDPVVPTATGVYPTANFHEREVYDFFGVRFEDHPNLVRILMPEDWVGHPGRKDYPLGGVDTDYHGADIPPPDERLWSRDVPGPGPDPQDPSTEFGTETGS